MAEHLVAQNRIGDLRRMQQVHLEQPRLEMPLLRLILLKRIKQEARRRLNHILRHEDIDHPLDVDKGSALVVHELRGELGALVWVGAHDVLQETDVVRVEADFVGVKEDLVGLAGLGEAGDDFVRDVGAEVDAQSEREVVQANDVAELLAACQL